MHHPISPWASDDYRTLTNIPCESELSKYIQHSLHAKTQPQKAKHRQKRSEGNLRPKKSHSRHFSSRRRPETAVPRNPQPKTVKQHNTKNKSVSSLTRLSSQRVPAVQKRPDTRLIAQRVFSGLEPAAHKMGSIRQIYSPYNTLQGSLRRPQTGNHGVFIEKQYMYRTSLNDKKSKPQIKRIQISWHSGNQSKPETGYLSLNAKLSDLLQASKKPADLGIAITAIQPAKGKKPTGVAGDR